MPLTKGDDDELGDATRRLLEGRDEGTRVTGSFFIRFIA